MPFPEGRLAEAAVDTTFFLKICYLTKRNIDKAEAFSKIRKLRDNPAVGRVITGLLLGNPPFSLCDKFIVPSCSSDRVLP